MKKYIVLILTLTTIVMLNACKPKVESKNFTQSYVGHYKTLNYLVSSSGSDSDVYANLVDGLVENDNYGRIVPSLATSWEDEVVNGKHIWSFQIRKNVKWVEYSGGKTKEFDTVKANDWVEAAKYILNPNNASEITSLWFMFVENAEEYYCGIDLQQNPDSGCNKDAGGNVRTDFTPTTDFSKVGVKATGEYELQYTLKKPAPYFLTSLTYSSFYPVNGSYLQEAGDKFGYDGENILINGAYVLTEDVENTKMVLVKNEDYWDKNHVYINSITFVYSPASAGFDWARLKFENNELSQFRIQELDKEGWKKYITGNCTETQCEGSKENPVNPNVFVSEAVGKYSYFSLWNWGRENYAGSKTTTNQRNATKLALLNKDFRLGFFYGMKREDFLAQYTSSNPLQWARNTYTPKELAKDQNGVDYVDYFAQVYAEKNGITQEAAIEKLKDGVEGKLDVQKAKQHFAKAKQELLAKGLTEADFPIIVETIATNDPNRLPFARALADFVNNNYGDIAKLELLVPKSDNEWREWSNQYLSYDLRLTFGWGPDFADPLTYANTYVVNGDVLDYSGLVGKMDLQQQLLGTYTTMVQNADKIWETDRLNERYRAFAEAEYYLTYENALIIPLLSQSGNNVWVSKVKPFTAMRAPYGLSISKFKHMVVLDEPITNAYRTQLEQDYETNRPAK